MTKKQRAINISVGISKLKYKEDFSNETAQTQLDNIMLPCKLEEVEEDTLHLHGQIKGLEEKLKERTELN